MFRSLQDSQSQPTQQPQQQPKVSFWDILKEVPGAIKQVSKKIGGFLYDIPKHASRTSLSIGLSTPLGKGFREGDKTQIDPKEFGIEGITGSDPIESLGTTQKRYKDYLGSKGIQSAGVLAPIGVAGSTAIDLMFGSGKTAKMAITSIAKNTNRIDNILSNLSHFKISDSIKQEIAPKLLRMTDNNAVSQLIKSSEIISDIEKRTQLPVPKEIRGKIAEALVNTDFNNKKEAQKVIKEVTDYFVSNVPKREQLVSSTTKKLDGYAQHLDTKDIDEFAIKDELDAMKKQIQDPKLPLQEVKNVEQQADDLVMAHLEKKGAVAKEIANREEVIQMAKKSNSLEEFKGSLLESDSLHAQQLLKDEKATKDLFMKAKLDLRNAKELASQGLVKEVKPGLPGITGLKKVGLAPEKPKRIVKDEKTLLRSQVKAESITAKKVATAVKKADVTATKRAMEAGGREVRRVEKRGNKAVAATKKADYQALGRYAKSSERRIKETGKNAKAIGNKIGAFKQKAKDSIRIKQIFSDIKKGKETEENFKKAIRQYVSDLPKESQAKLLSTEQFGHVKSGQKLRVFLNKVDNERLALKNSAQKSKEKFDIKTRKLEILRDVKPLLKLNKEKGIISRVIKQLNEAGFKSLIQKGDKFYKKGLLGLSEVQLEKVRAILKDNIDTTPKNIDVSNVDWKEVAKEGVGSSKGKSFTEKLGRDIESGFGIASSNLRKRAGDKVFSLLREYSFKVDSFGGKASNEVRGFIKGMSKMNRKMFGNKADYQNMTHALLNQDFERASEIAKKHGFEKEFDKVKSFLDEIHTRAKEAGLKVGKLENYFPRVVADYDGLFEAYNKKFGKEGRSYLDKVLTSYASKKYRSVVTLTQEERAEALTNAIRGYGEGKINVGNVSRARQFKELPPEFMKFYHTPEQSLVMYGDKMNKRIELKKLFNLNDTEQDNIGAMLDGFNMSPSDLEASKEIIGAILAPKTGENIVSITIRKSATITLLANIASTIFQTADISKNAYKFGIFKALGSLFRKKPFKRDELFNNITHEFSDSKLVSNSLKAVGFDRLDKLNNEAFMANAFREASSLAKKGKGGSYNDFKEYANVVFRGDENRIAKFIEDVKNKKVNDETKLYVYNKVLDVDPRSLMEMPEAYLKHPNWRLAYSMKSYGLKVMDMFRQEMRSGKPTYKKAYKMVKLAAFLTAGGATGSQLRDWYNGKDSSISDNVMNNALQLMMFSTYDISNIKKDGAGNAIINKFAPPMRLINDISKDITSAGDGKGLQSIRNIPIIGSEAYNRLGKGKSIREKANAPVKQKLLRGSSNVKSRLNKSKESSRLK
jgi:hypothetical protein